MTSRVVSNLWEGKIVTITGFDGKLVCMLPDRSILTRRGTAAATWSDGSTVEFVVEKASPTSRYGEDMVAFRVKGKELYLTLNMYGDAVRGDMLTNLARLQTPLLPELLPLIIDYTVARATPEDNFEGSGFNYSPMTAEAGPPSCLQVFRIEGHRRQTGVGIRSPFGTYWRSEHWNSTVSQAPHVMGDETWTLAATS
jgi:hypothetical protein